MGHLIHYVVLLMFTVVATDTMTFDFARFSGNCRNKGICSRRCTSYKEINLRLVYSKEQSS
uniref:Uncharacterized protein n=1 Tax=Parascaris univalens TaxID=6257 RepID=A0A915AK62_PARUN